MKNYNEIADELFIRRDKYYKKLARRKKCRLKKMAVAMIVVVCFGISMPVLATNVEPIYYIMYFLSPSAAQFFQIVQKSDESNGIRMEVVSADVRDDTAKIYITMQDLTGDRIDETIDLYDSYYIRVPLDCSAHCQRVDYNADTKTASFLITINAWEGKKIPKNKVTFAVREFISKQNKFEDVYIPYDFSHVSENPKTKIVQTHGGGEAYEEAVKDSFGMVTALEPTKPYENFVVDGIDFTGIGYIDGKLHIQTAVENPLENDNHGCMYLKNGAGEIFDLNYYFSFTNHMEKEGRIDYAEYVYDIPKEKLMDYELYGDFWVSGSYTKGNWKVTFSLK